MSKFLIMALYSPHLIKKLEEDLKKDPSSKSFCALAHIYHKQGDIQKAKLLCFQGLSHHPAYSQAIILLADIYYKENQLSEAVKLLSRAKELSPDNPHIYKNLAQIYKKQNQPEKTLKAYKMLAFLSPNDSTAVMSVQHLEKILRPSLVLSDPAKEQSKDESLLEKAQKLSSKQNQRLVRLNQILARVENYIEQTAKS
ncbi:MAG: tetratricopeptide repeat protein [Oligoflexia bacterium]|nr:tetratricopeptide repeat protein [Oligoflexia bacterium]